MRWMQALMAIAFFTASCDVVLTVELGGTFRLAQLMLALVMLGAVANILQNGGRILWPRGGTALLTWCALQGLFLFGSTAGITGLLLYLLLIFTIAGVYAVLQVYGRSGFLEPLFRLYLKSYVFVALFGLFQLVTPSLHLGEYLVQQWILHGRIPRISGFSYEPSYYVTYLAMGWIMLVDLQYSKARLTQGRVWRWMTILTGAIFFLSTSKTAWIMMLIEGGARLAPVLGRHVRAEWRRLNRGSLKIPLPSWKLPAGLALGSAVIALGLFELSNVVHLNVFLAGTGINHTAAHSINERSNRFVQTVAVIREQPWIGRSLGGVAGRIASMNGADVHSTADLRLSWGFPVIVDVIAASGLIGVLPFLWFFAVNTVGEFGLIRRCWPDERAKWLRALVRALIFEFLMLLADQNLLRVYLWIHVTMLVTVGYQLRYVCAGRGSGGPSFQADPVQA